jgi:DNA-directed RNA polymerase specialized sigma24 family protein
MARALSKMKLDGTLYVRPAAIERQIDEVLSLGIVELRQRLMVADKNAGGYLRHETLVHLIRLSILENRPEVSGAVLPVLLVRCEKNLEATVSDELRDAPMVREDILGEFSERLALDSTTEPGVLDFFECRFNLAFSALRTDVVRRALTRLKYEGEPESADLPEDELYGQPESLLKKLIDNLSAPPTQEWEALGGRIIAAIKKLPRDERKAVILVHILGYQQGSDDPTLITAATRCKCDPRTIYNRLQRAEKRLSAFKEYV